MTNQLQALPMRIAILDPGGSGSKVATYYLPPCDKQGGLSLEWVMKAVDTTLFNGGESTRLLGWLPELKCKWSVYDDLNAFYGYTIGSAAGNQLDFNSFLAVLDTNPGFLSVSPGLTAGGFVVNKVTVSNFSVTSVGSLATGVTVTFRGGTIYANKTLGAF